MKRARRIILGTLAGIALLVGGVWLLTYALDARLPTYHGKTIEYWSDQLTNSDVQIRERATALAQAEIIPALTREMFCDTNDSKLKIELIDQLNGIPGIHINFLPADGRRANAASDLGSLGPAAKSAIADLVKAAQGNDSPVVGPAISSLVQVQAGPDILVPVLLPWLIPPGRAGRTEAIEALGELGGQSKVAVPLLITLLDDHSSKDLMNAVRKSLKQIDPEAAAQVGVP